MKCSGFSKPVLCNTAIKYNSNIYTAVAKDELAIEIVKALATGEKQLTRKHSRTVPLSECIVDNAPLYVYSLLYVPDDETFYWEILNAAHDHLAAKYPGRAANYELVSRNYWWPGRQKTIAR